MIPTFSVIFHRIFVKNPTKSHEIHINITKHHHEIHIKNHQITLNSSSTPMNFQPFSISDLRCRASYAKRCAATWPAPFRYAAATAGKGWGTNGVALQWYSTNVWISQKSMGKSWSLLESGGLEHFCHFSRNSWECHHPNWWTHIFQRAKPPTSIVLTIILIHISPINIWNSH